MASWTDDELVQSINLLLDQAQNGVRVLEHEADALNLLLRLQWPEVPLDVQQTVTLRRAHTPDGDIWPQAHGPLRRTGYHATSVACALSVLLEGRFRPADEVHPYGLYASADATLIRWYNWGAVFCLALNGWEATRADSKKLMQHRELPIGPIILSHRMGGKERILRPEQVTVSTLTLEKADLRLLLTRLRGLSFADCLTALSAVIQEQSGRAPGSLAAPEEEPDHTGAPPKSLANDRLTAHAAPDMQPCPGEAAAPATPVAAPRGAPAIRVAPPVPKAGWPVAPVKIEQESVSPGSGRKRRRTSRSSPSESPDRLPDHMIVCIRGPSETLITSIRPNITPAALLTFALTRMASQEPTATLLRDGTRCALLRDVTRTPLRAWDQIWLQIDGLPQPALLDVSFTPVEFLPTLSTWLREPAPEALHLARSQALDQENRHQDWERSSAQTRSEAASSSGRTAGIMGRLDFSLGTGSPPPTSAAETVATGGQSAVPALQGLPFLPVLPPPAARIIPPPAPPVRKA